MNERETLIYQFMARFDESYEEAEQRYERHEKQKTMAEERKIANDVNNLKVRKRQAVFTQHVKACQKPDDEVR